MFPNPELEVSRPRIQTFAATQSWLVVAPHPDDEVFATGGLLQCAQQAGARVAVLLLTDGDNNPWPQRWIEKRWRIDANARRRWASRRRAETSAALTVLGLDPTRDLIALAWPDSEIGSKLISEPTRQVAELVANLRALAPTHVVVPAADDGHPDHNAAAVAMSLALSQLQHRPEILAYRVHGRRGDEPISITVSPLQSRLKRCALQQYTSQLALSRRRMVKLASVERFVADPFVCASSRALELLLADGCDSGAVLHMNGFDPGWNPLCNWRLMLLLEMGGGELKGHRVDLGSRVGRARFNRKTRQLELRWPLAGVRRLFAKLEPNRRGVWIYDRYGWCSLTLSGGDPLLPRGDACASHA